MKKILLSVFGLVLSFQIGCSNEMALTGTSTQALEEATSPTCAACAHEGDDSSNGGLNDDSAGSGSDSAGGSATDEEMPSQNPDSMGPNTMENGEKPTLPPGTELPPPQPGSENCCKPGKVLICHNVENNAHNICVARAAMDAHMAHLGDYLGACK